MTILAHHWVYDDYWKHPTDQLLPLFKCSLEFLIQETSCVMSLPIWITHTMKTTLTDTMIKEYIAKEVECEEERMLLDDAYEKFVRTN